MICIGLRNQASQTTWNVEMNWDPEKRFKTWLMGILSTTLHASSLIPQMHPSNVTFYPPTIRAPTETQQNKT